MPLAAYGYVPTLKRVFDRLGYTPTDGTPSLNVASK